MNGVALANWLGVVVAVCVSLTAALWSDGDSEPTRIVPAAHAGVEVVVRDGQRGLLDASGAFLALADFRRVVSVDLVADDLLLALCEPERIIAFSAYAKHSAGGYRFGDKGLKKTSFDPETLIALKPDLVLVNNLSRQDRIARLREGGFPVFDLGEMRGLSTLIPNIHTVATLLGRPQAGVELASSVRIRMATLASGLHERDRKGGLYVGIHGDKIYGGTRGTSFADVLAAAGIIDQAAERYSGWPRYTSEQLLQLDPQVIVTQHGMASVLCRHPGLDSLAACGDHGAGVFEVDENLLQDPGLDMVLAAEAVHRAVYGDLAHRVSN